MSKISIITALFNQFDYTRNYVEQVKRLSGDWELILVDNGSTDETENYLKYLNDNRIKVIRSEENLGFAKGNNLGFKEASGQHILFMNNDVDIDEDFLVKYQDYLHNNPKTLIGCELVTNNNLVSLNGVTFPYINGWCVFGSKDLFETIAYQNKGDVYSSDFPHYFEDAWLSYQAIHLGYELKQIPVKVTHFVSKSSGSVNKTRMTQIGQEVFRTKVRHHQWREEGKKRIVFYVNDVSYDFNETDYDGKGVGGAESALIFLAKELAKNDEYRVEIYNKSTTVGVFNNVHYYDKSQYLEHYADVFVLFRSYSDQLFKTPAVRKIFWSCDQRTDGQTTWEQLIFPYVDSIVTISEYHKNYLLENYEVDPKKIITIPISTRMEDYKEPVKKVLGKAIFCSVPTRGLDMLARVAPMIKEKVHNFTLVITSDFRLWGLKDATNKEYVEMFKNLPYVSFLGKVTREELVKHQLESQVMTYPSNYDECFCISALEGMASGAVPVTIDCGAIGETVSYGGKVLSNGCEDEEYVDSVVELLIDESKRLELEQKGKLRASELTWPLIAKEWSDLINKSENEMPSKKTNQSAKAKAEMKPEPKVMQVPTHTRKRFKVPVVVSINGKNFPSNGVPAMEFEVPFEYAEAVSQQVELGYGDVEK